jgi:mono/diheme cytochrome c family protein
MNVSPLLKVTPRIALFLTAVLSSIALSSGTAFAQSAVQGTNEVWVAPARAARKQNPVPSDAKSIATGKELFVAGCLPCHGPAGKGDGPAAISLERKPGNLSDPKLHNQSDGALFWKVSEGKTPMPSFQEAFTEEQRWQIINYVRTLAPKPDSSEKSKTPSEGK